VFVRHVVGAGICCYCIKRLLVKFINSQANSYSDHCFFLLLNFYSLTRRAQRGARRKRTRATAGDPRPLGESTGDSLLEGGAHALLNLKHVFVLELQGWRVARVVETLDHLLVDHGQRARHTLAVLFVEGAQLHLREHGARHLALGREAVGARLVERRVGLRGRALALVAHEAGGLGGHARRLRVEVGDAVSVVGLLGQRVQRVRGAGGVVHIVETLGRGLGERRLLGGVVHSLVGLALEGLVEAALRKGEVLALLLVDSLLPGGMLVLVRKETLSQTDSYVCRA